MTMSQIFIHMIRLLYLKLCLSINSHTHHSATDFQLDWMTKNEKSIYCVESMIILSSNRSITQISDEILAITNFSTDAAFK